jgi:hypothetical protein
MVYILFGWTLYVQYRDSRYDCGQPVKPCTGIEPAVTFHDVRPWLCCPLDLKYFAKAPGCVFIACLSQSSHCCCSKLGVLTGPTLFAATGWSCSSILGERNGQKEPKLWANVSL